VVGHGLGDDVDRVRVVEDARAVWEVLQDLPHDVDRAQRHEQAARPLRLLADHAVGERDLLVQHARLEPARPVAGQHRVAGVQAGAAVRRRGDGELGAPRRGHALGEPADQLQAIGVEVDEDDLRAGEVLRLLDEAGHGARGPRRPTADVRDLDPRHDGRV
jgi:hypothetical protein